MTLEGQRVDVRTASVLDSPPMLQHPSPTGMTLLWAVRGPATGWVEYGTEPTALTRRAEAPSRGLLPLADRFLAVRLEGLEPGQQIFYRVVAVPVRFESAYHVHRGEPQRSAVYHFRTPDPSAAGANFLSISDTHEQPRILAAVAEALQRDAPEVLVWNGDLFNEITGDEQIVQQVLRPIGHAHAAERPLLFGWGNHDVRGAHARAVEQALRPWPVTASQPATMGKCFAVRQGPLALIGLDTGEDKPDRHPVFAGLAHFEAYREAQAAWLERVLREPAIASARWLVVFCHIPLWGLPGENPGDTLEGYAWYCRQAQRVWHPVLEAHGAQVVISGHLHEHRYLPPEAGRRYAQIVAGGPDPADATCVRGQVVGDRLAIRLERLTDGQPLGHWSLPPRACAMPR